MRSFKRQILQKFQIPRHSDKYFKSRSMQIDLRTNWTKVLFRMNQDKSKLKLRLFGLNRINLQPICINRDLKYFPDWFIIIWNGSKQISEEIGLEDLHQPVLFFCSLLYTYMYTHAYNVTSRCRNKSEK